MRWQYSLFYCQTFHNPWVKFSNPVLWFNSVDLMLKIKGVLEACEIGENLLNGDVGPNCVIHSGREDLRLLPGLAVPELLLQAVPA